MDPVAPQSIQQEPEVSPKAPAMEACAECTVALYVHLKNEDKRFDEYLPFKISVSPGGVDKKDISGEKHAFIGKFKPGTYLIEIDPVPPAGEELGPVPWQEDPKFRHTVTLSSHNKYLPITVTRTDAINYNIMMTFLVEKGTATDPGKSWYEAPKMAANTEDQPFIEQYAAEFGLDADWVNAICYMETTHGYYDAVLPLIGRKPKSIRPMNVNIDAWRKLLAARGVDRAGLEKNDINVREGCFLLHRLFVRAKPQTLLAVASLYNSHHAEYLLEYGYHVQRICNQKLWLEQLDTEPPMLSPCM